MPGPSPLFAVNDNTAQIAHELIYATEFRLRIDSMSNVDTYEFRVIGWSDTDISNIALTFTDLGKGEVSATFYEAPGDTTGRSILVECVVNGMRNAQGKLDSSLRLTRVMGVQAADGIIPAASGETYERDPKLGWLSLLKRAGGGIGAVNVTASVDGTLNTFPNAVMRLAGSDGSTAGGEWSVKNKAFLDAAIAENSVGIDKLASGGATNGQILLFNNLTGNWEVGNQQTIPSPPAVPVTSITDSGIAVVTNVGTVWNVHVPAPAEAGAPTVIFYDYMECIIMEGDGFDPTAPGDYFGGAVAVLGRTFFYLSTDIHQGPYVVTDQTTGAVVAERHSSWSGVKDLTIKYVWPVGRAQDTAGASALIFTTSNTGTVTVGTGSVTFRTTIDQYTSSAFESYVEHAPCKAHATIPVDITACPSFIDGIEFASGAVGSRIYLSKQVDPIENGPWELHTWSSGTSTWRLQRPADWDYGAILRSGTTHRFQIFAGKLWPEHIVELYIGASMFVGDGVHAGAGGAWNVTEHYIPDCDATEGTIAVDADWEYTPRGCSSTERKSVRVTGWIKAGEDYRAGIFEGSEQLIPFEVVAGSSTDYSTTYEDDVGGSWSIPSSSIGYVYRDTSNKIQGTSSWALYLREDGFTNSGWMGRGLTLPANHRAQIRTKSRKAFPLGTGSILKIRVGENVAELGESKTAYSHQYDCDDLGALEVTSTSTWTDNVFSIAATNRARTVFFSMYAYATSTAGLGFPAGWIDAMHFAHTIDGFSSRLYIDAEYGPASDPKRLSYPDDEQDDQIDDSSNQLGGPSLCGLDMDADCRLFMSSLGIERHYAFTMLMTPISEAVTAPGLPAETTLPAYPY